MRACAFALVTDEVITPRNNANKLPLKCGMIGWVVYSRGVSIRDVKMIHQAYGEDTPIGFSVFSPHEAAKYKFSLEKKNVNLMIIQGEGEEISLIQQINNA